MFAWILGRLVPTGGLTVLGRKSISTFPTTRQRAEAARAPKCRAPDIGGGRGGEGGRGALRGNKGLEPQEGRYRFASPLAVN